MSRVNLIACQELSISLNLAVPKWLLVLLAILYFLTALVGLVGNIMVCVAVIRLDHRTNNSV